jgi:predicted nucleic acid-binding protein
MDGQVLIHPFIVGELALGNFHNRAEIISLLQSLPHISVASENEVLTFITRNQLSGSGIGYVDAHLIASCLLQGDAKVITRDKKLASVAVRMLPLS